MATLLLYLSQQLLLLLIYSKKTKGSDCFLEKSAFTGFGVYRAVLLLLFSLIMLLLCVVIAVECAQQNLFLGLLSLGSCRPATGYVSTVHHCRISRLILPNAVTMMVQRQIYDPFIELETYLYYHWKFLLVNFSLTSPLICNVLDDYSHEQVSYSKWSLLVKDIFACVCKNTNTSSLILQSHPQQHGDVQVIFKDGSTS